MTTGMQIVREETRRMLRGMAPLTLIAFGVFVLAGCDPVQAGVSLLLFPPAQGIRIVRRGYFFRYVLTGVMVFAAIKTPFIQPLAAILPLFFPKVILLWSAAVQKKGG